VQDVCRPVDQLQWHDPLFTSNATALAVLEKLATLNAPARLMLAGCHHPLSWWKQSGYSRTKLLECPRFPTDAAGTRIPPSETKTTHPKEGVHRTLLMSLVPAYHGSTALLSLYMSNSGISTLCRGMSWECEGGKLGEEDQHDGPEHPPWFRANTTAGKPCRTHPFRRSVVTNDAGFIETDVQFRQMVKGTVVTNNGKRDSVRHRNPPKHTNIVRRSGIQEAVRTFGRVWNLSNPVLVEKDPDWFYSNMEDLHSALMVFKDITGPLASVRPVYVVMWRPLCLSSTSSHFRNEATNAGIGAFAHEVSKLERTVQLAEWAIATEGVKMELLNYADLLWNPQRVVASLQRLLPCIAGRGYSPYFRPQLNKDYFHRNRFKVSGSTGEYGKAHPPTTSFLRGSMYNVKLSRCTKTASYPHRMLSHSDALKFAELLKTNRMLESRLERLTLALAKHNRQQSSVSLARAPPN
jgi:hypothetical protein